jgi:hypothetical protein
MYDLSDKFHIILSTETPSCTRFHFLVSVNIQIILLWNLIPCSHYILGLLPTQIFQGYRIFYLICLRQISSDVQVSFAVLFMNYTSLYNKFLI